MPTPQQNQWVASVLAFRVGGAGDGEGKGALGKLIAKVRGRRAPPPVVTPTPPVVPPPVVVPETRQEARARVKQELRRKQAFGAHQEAVSDERYAALKDRGQEDFTILMSAARSPTEGNFLRKALAANHSLDEIAAFAAEIRGKDEDWLLDNLMVTGDARGKGIQQQFVMSCQATTVQAVKGALDPIYALSLHKATGDIAQVTATTTGTMAAEQKALLETPKPGETTGGVAESLAAYNAAQAAGRAGDEGEGRSGNDLLNAASDVTQVEYETVYITDQTERIAAVNDIASRLDQGMPVPLSVGGAQDELAHYVLALATDKGPPRRFYIHDPGSGKTVTVRESAMLGNRMKLPSGWDFLNKYEKPKPKPKPTPTTTGA